MIDLTVFADRLNEQMILHNIKAPELAKILQVEPVTVYALKRGAHLPDTQVLFSMLTFFRCSADYLLGLIEFSPENTTYASPFTQFGKLFRDLLQASNTSQYELTKNAKISGNLIYKWLHDQAVPSVANLIKLAEYMDIPLDVVIGRSKF